MRWATGTAATLALVFSSAGTAWAQVDGTRPATPASSGDNQGNASVPSFPPGDLVFGARTKLTSPQDQRPHAVADPAGLPGVAVIEFRIGLHRGVKVYVPPAPCASEPGKDTRTDAEARPAPHLDSSR